jgi:Transposase DDE domain
MENVVSRGIPVLIPPDSGVRKGTRPGWNKGLHAFMRRLLATDHGRSTYRQRMATVEPVFGQTKFNRRFDRFQRRGRSAVRSEWRLAAATHNLLKLHSHRMAAASAQTTPSRPTRQPARRRLGDSQNSHAQLR